MSDQYDREIAVIDSVENAPPLKKFAAYAKLSGPGWLQGAITLGGGSLAGALYLGVISGFGLMWLQPLAMICGIIMLSAIAYVTLSTGNRPFHSINKNLHPLLGWSWIIATMMANMVWVMPQFALGTAAMQQNLGILQGTAGTTFIILLLFAVGMGVNYLYQTEGKGAKAFDLVIKVMVGIIVLSFFAVVFALLASGKLEFGKILTGYLPNPAYLFKPAAVYESFIADSAFSDFWRNKIVSEQQDVIIAAFGTAVGINMTFLLPYSLLKKRWGQKHRGLSITDLSIGLFIPFFLATSCVVISAASSFHGKAELPTGDALETSRVAVAEMMQQDPAQVREADIMLNEMLTKRDADSLAETLEPFAGEFIAQKIFGIGVLGMAMSTIVILMLMNGLAFQEAFSRDGRQGGIKKENSANISSNRTLYFIGCGLSGLSGACFPWIWTGESKAALAVPTSVIGGSLIPIAYFTFFLMMNSKKILGEHRPEGKARLIWNVLMIFATTVATLGSVWVLHGKTAAGGWISGVAWGGLAFLVILFVVGGLSFFKHEKEG
ncbi:divalent metal cation transporter [Roseibacillus ishigakijimensis]|uniref:Divalent metal cation transporter n=1 Tax=Roseibacillus ishigakijimensis TaxID=454146 RepID=A0A934RNP6_9BACT|nr:divalent metal cation transporter [Roseibacillus ishigakijimensis]MBK1835147.1 divalent metal cation transporter [Roseibacillus ishigakijimensis]